MQLILITFFSIWAVVCAEAEQARICKSYSSDIPFSGYKIEFQYRNRGTFHLYMCRQGKSIGTLFLNESIPYGQDLCVAEGHPCLFLARTKAASRRKNAMFFPGDVIGGIYQKNGTALEPIAPLIAENALKFHWVEFKGLRRAIIHVPILATLGIDSTRNGDTLWLENINVYEQYQGVEQTKMIMNHIMDKIIPGSANFIFRVFKSGAGLVNSVVRDGTALLWSGVAP